MVQFEVAVMESLELGYRLEGALGFDLVKGLPREKYFGWEMGLAKAKGLQTEMGRQTAKDLEMAKGSD